MNTTNNTNMMTICQIFAQKQGGQVAPLNRKNASGAFRDDIPANETTDKSQDLVTRKTNKDEKTRFDDTLRKKMDADAPSKPDDTKSMKKKDLDRKGGDGMPDVPVQPNETPQNAIQKQESAFDLNTLEINRLSVNGTTDAVVGEDTDSTVTVDKAAENLALNASIKAGTRIEARNADQTAASAADRQTEKGPVTNSEPMVDNETPQQHAKTPISTGTVTAAEDKTKYTNNLSMSEKAEKPAADHDILKDIRELPTDKIIAENGKTPVITAKDTGTGKGDSQTQTPSSAFPQNTQASSDASKEQAFIHRINVSMEQIEAIKAEKQHQISQKADLKVEFGLDKHLPNDISTPHSVTEMAPIAGRPSEIVIHEGSRLNVGQQIQESVRTSYTSGTQQIIIRLDPPDLGRVTIKFTEHKDGITGTLYVDKADTKYEIQQALPSIMQNLQNLDIQIRKMDVVLNQQQDHTAGEFANPNDGFQQQHASSQHADSAGMSYEQDVSPVNGYHSADSYMELSDKSINMLI